MSEKCNLTRFTTTEERENTKCIELDTADLEKFMELLRSGMIEAAAEHVAAVQDNFALRAEMTIRLSRPVRDNQGEVTELVGRNMLEGTVRARKVYYDPEKSPEASEKKGVALRVGLEIEGEGVKGGGEGPVVVEVFVEVGFTVAVEIVEAGDLVVADDVDGFIDDFANEGLVQAGGEALPVEMFEFFVDAGDDPGRHRSRLVRAARRPSAKKSNAADAHPRVVGVLIGKVRLSTT